MQTKTIAGSDGHSKHHGAPFDKNNQAMVTFSTVGLQKGKLSTKIINKFHLFLLNREFSFLRELEESWFFLLYKRNIQLSILKQNIMQICNLEKFLLQKTTSITIQWFLVNLNTTLLLLVYEQVKKIKVKILFKT